MNDDDLLASTRELVAKSCAIEADLLLHLGEIDARRLYAARAFPSMVAFCVKELGFSEGAAYNRINVARAARSWPAILDAVRSGAIHLAGLRILAPHLTDQNHEGLLAEAAGKSKREIEELAAGLSPKPPVPDSVRKLPERQPAQLWEASPPSPVPANRPEVRRPIIAPLSADTFQIQFTAPRALGDKLREAQDLLRHRVPSGELAVVFDKALEALIVNLKKERFAVGRKPRNDSAPAPRISWSRNIPDAIKRAVYERDQGRCAFVDESGRRCSETGGLEFDHIDGFARTHVHDVDRIRLACSVHNRHAAEQMYGRAFLDRIRSDRKESRAAASTPMTAPAPALARPGASGQQSLFWRAPVHGGWRAPPCPSGADADGERESQPVSAVPGPAASRSGPGTASAPAPGPPRLARGCRCRTALPPESRGGTGAPRRPPSAR